MRGLACILSALLLTSPARAEWWVAETDHFIVYSEGKAKETEVFTQRLERFAMAMRTMQNMPAKPGAMNRRLTIYRWGEVSDIARLYGDIGSPVAGFFIPRAAGSVAFVPAREEFNGSSLGTRDSDEGQLGSETILFHEYVHHFMMQYFPTAYPAWYIEGFAEVYSTAEFLENGVFRIGNPANHRGMQLFYDDFPVKKLFEAKIKPEDTRHHYSVGWLLTHYLTFTPARAGQLKKYLAAVSRGTASDEAARQSFGDLDKLEREVQRYKTSRLIGYEVKPAGYVAPQVKLRALTVAETAIIGSKMRSDRGVTKKSAPRVAAQARAKAKPYPNVPFVQTALAEAEFDADNLDAAKVAADRALSGDPSSVDALNYLGMVEMERAKKDPSRYAIARTWFVKANKLQPNNPEPLINNYLSFAKAGQKIPELAIIGLERAFELAPFDRDVRFLLARQLLGEGRGKGARSVLLPVAVSAHGGKTKEAAEKIIASIDTSDLKAAVALADKHIENAHDEEK